MGAILKSTLLSFYSGTFYHALARRYQGAGIGLTLALSLYLTLFYSLLFFAAGGYGQARDAITRLPEIASSLPAVTVKDGKLSINKPSPYILTFGQAPDEMRLVVDPDYKVGSLDSLMNYIEQNHIMALITQDKIISRDLHGAGRGQKSGGKLQINDLKDTQSFSMTHDDWVSFASAISRWGAPLLMLFVGCGILIALFIIHFIATVCTAIVVMVLGLLSRTVLEFAACMRLSAALRIPATLLASAPLLIGHTPLMGAAGWGLWLIYVGFAIISVRLGDRNPG